MRDTANSGVLKGSRSETKVGWGGVGWPPKFMDIRLVKGKKSDILMDGDSASVKHDMHFNISIISSQLGEEAGVGVSFLS